MVGWFLLPVFPGRLGVLPMVENRNPASQDSIPEPSARKANAVPSCATAAASFFIERGGSTTFFNRERRKQNGRRTLQVK